MKTFLFILLIGCAISLVLVVDYSQFVGGLYIPEPRTPLFLGLSIIFGSALIALTLSLGRNRQNIYETYLELQERLSDGPLAMEELEKVMGATSKYHVESDGTARFQSRLSSAQRQILAQLAYEGRILISQGQVSLPRD
ncbi:MAG: hypothetical protein Q7Q71_09690 [Verrucomicrobiota bacterium JB023]|nr:hypothetical protein [Verrucomicrobiota bacterium JB023]